MVNRFGTTSDMVIQSVTEKGLAYLLAIDDRGLYLTTQDKLDHNLADPNRYTSNRKEVTERLTALGFDPIQLFEQNLYRIKRESEEKKRINPLKASKRGMKA